jgi:hypothetical protein
MSALPRIASNGSISPGRRQPFYTLMAASAVLGGWFGYPQIQTHAAASPRTANSAAIAPTPSSALGGAAAESLSLESLASFFPRSGQATPIIMSVPTDIISGGASVVESITVNSVPSNGSYIQVGCNHPELVSPPSGSWPYRLLYSGGDPTTKSITVTTSAPSVDTVVILYACKDGVDSTNSANWTATKTVTITAQGAH